MRKLLSAVVAGSFIFSSCTEKEEILISRENGALQTKAHVCDADFQVVDYNGESCIQFRNDSVFKDFLSQMSGSETREVFSRLGFESQADIMEQAEEEQEAIVDDYERDLSQEFPHQQIEDFKRKYGDVFLFNPYDSTDFIPNYKISAYKYFTNRQGVFLIGDSVVNAPQYQIEQLFGSDAVPFGSNEHTDYSSRNKAETKYQIPGGDYVKVRVITTFTGIHLDDAHRENRVFGFELLSQKKKVLWKRHHADLYMTYELKGIKYGTPSEIIFSEKEKKIHVYGKINAEENPVGHIAPSTTSSYRYTLGGKMEIWSNEIPIRGYATVRLEEGKN